MTKHSDYGRRYKMPWDDLIGRTFEAEVIIDAVTGEEKAIFGGLLSPKVIVAEEIKEDHQKLLAKA